jgi:hypothetical protein
MQLIEQFQVKENSAFDRTHLLALRKEPRFKAQTHLVYIYELAPDEPAVNYPCGFGRVLYIGEACRQTQPSGARFGQHIGASLTAGNDPGSNFALTHYYHRGIGLLLTVYEVSELERVQREKDLLIWHARTFGALPIAQGMTGENYTIVAVLSYPAQVPDHVVHRHSVI